MNTFLKDILTYVASNLAQAVRIDTINNCDNNTYEYLKRVNEILLDISDNPNSVYHVISANDAKLLIINAIVYGYPLLRRMTPSEKSSFINSIAMNVNAFFVEYEAAKKIPEGPVEDNTTEDKADESETTPPTTEDDSDATTESPSTDSTI